MIIAIPVSSSDLPRFPKQIAALYKFGGLENHSVIIFPTPSCAGEVAAIAEPLSQLSREFKVVPIDIEPEGGWPRACNQHFAGVWQKFYEMGNTEPVLWLEVDAYGAKYGWPNLLVAKYNQSGKLYMGHLRNTSEVTTPPMDGKHMVGVGMYPGDFYNRTRLWAYIRDDVPFDIWLRWEISPKAFNTNLIQHMPRSKDFKIVDGKLVGISEENPNKPQEVVVDHTALIVHGCKDGTLSDALVEGGELQGVNFEATINMPEPDLEDTKTPVFQAVKNAIREWSIGVPGAYEGDRRAGDQHVAVIVGAIYADKSPKTLAVKTQDQEVVAIDGRQRRLNARNKQPKPSGHLIG